MLISEVLRNKSHGVVTVRPDDTVSRLLELLAEHGVGALVVSTEGPDIAGIVSERDVVRYLHSQGSGILDQPVSAIMTATVITCTKDEEVADLASTMTDRHIRHVPVVDDDGNMVAIVSIGDVVKSRISQLQAERDHLERYIQQ